MTGETNQLQKMEFTSNLNILPENKSSLFATGSVTIDQLFVIHDVKVIYLQKEGMDEKQLTVCMPRHYNRKTESWDHVVQLTKEQRQDLEKAVIQDLSQKINSSICSPEEYCTIRINLCEPSLFPTLAYAEISYRDMLCLKKVRIAEGKNGNIQVIFPANRNKDGSYSTLFGMVTSDHRRELEDAVREKYRDVYREMTGKEYTGTPKREENPDASTDPSMIKTGISDEAEELQPDELSQDMPVWNVSPQEEASGEKPCHGEHPSAAAGRHGR